METENTINSRPQFKMDKPKWILLAVLILAVAVGIAKARWELMENTTKTAGYQAVFLTNNQVYFGKLTGSHGFYKLTDIYYLQVTQNLQQATADAKNPTSTGTAQTQPNIQLVKLGSELHGPEDTMYIDRDKVLFWENMKDESKVVQAIHQYQTKK
ncbi:MAG: hypothetical protein KW802_01940 [Candidatus Doudnabacteria bacterium]|nr:hypothetical protein [Candidatus Doudnabacteria bacterium]